MMRVAPDELRYMYGAIGLELPLRCSCLPQLPQLSTLGLGRSEGGSGVDRWEMEREAA